MIPYDFSLLTPPPPGESDTDLWLKSRLGRITASSRAHKILYSRQSTLNNMMDEMGQELTQPVQEWHGNAATKHGHQFEGQAIGEYAMASLTQQTIYPTPGMFVHPDFDIASATPDFFEGDDTTGQVKCPFLIKNHLNLLHFGVKMVNVSYFTQVQFEAFVTGRPNIVFVSYHPEATATAQVYIERIAIDEAMHSCFRIKLAEINHMLINGERYEVTKKPLGIDGIPELF